jgi:O-antigen ligase/polysaccharide polymerase Wzy-like membrane protein
VRVFLVALAGLLVGYMFLGRGFAHVGRPPIYIGEIVLVIGVICTGVALIKLRLRPAPSRIVWLLLAFMALGAARTIPYLGVYGVDALRDAVLWGYAVFALMMFVLAERTLLLNAMRLYGWVVPVFALWLPISWNLFDALSATIDPNAQGSTVPLVFFKSGDMAVHIAGSIAFLVFGTSVIVTARDFIWRSVVAVPLIWTAFVSATTNRGSLLALVAALGAVAIFAFLARRSRNWLPVITATAVLAVTLSAPGLVNGPGPPSATPPPVAVASGSALPGGQPTASPAGQPTSTPTGQPTSTPTGQPLPTPPSQPTPTPGRDVSVNQLFENIGSIFGSSNEGGLEGTKQFRLRWWSTIIDYTVFGPYFWTGKGFGVNLAEDDGFTGHGDRSLRAPHNSHFTALARMGVPGFVLWLLIQSAFSIGLLRSVLAHRRSGDKRLAAVGGWILVYWAAMMIDTSFDPYLEGPQGGIWFWTLFGLGLVIMRLTPRQRSS